MTEFHADPQNFTEILQKVHEDTSDEPITVCLAPGTYRGQVTITRDHLTLRGTASELTIFTNSLAANEILDDGLRRGTFRTYSFFVDANDFTAVSLSFVNEAGPGELADQALALYSDGDRITFDRCRFLGHQDTVFTAPLPPSELQSGGFRGPKEFTPRISGRQLFNQCYIEGTVDFIFGGAVAVFTDCEIYSKRRLSAGCGFVTAASTPEAQTYGYVFRSCRFTGDAEVQSVYLGRPWRDFAHVAILDSYLGDHIHPDHWDDWNKPQAHATVKFCEYRNYGPGAVSTLPSFARFLTDDEAGFYDIKRIWEGKF